MWGVVKKVLPKSALDKVAFLNKQKELEEVFDLDRLPKGNLLSLCTLVQFAHVAELGGRDPMSFATCGNPILHRYTHRSLGESHSSTPSRSASTSSIADVYYSAVNTPSSSRRQSLAGGAGLKMTAADQSRSRSHLDLPHTSADSSLTSKECSPNQAGDNDLAPLSRQTSRNSSGGEGPLQRIRSLSNFHLYLSPSRLANIDLLSDSDDDDTPRPPPPKKQLRPAILEQSGDSIAARRGRRPPLQLLGNLGTDDARSYSDRLQQHHAKVLETYRDTGVAEHLSGRRVVSPSPIRARPPGGASESQSGLSQPGVTPSGDEDPRTPRPDSLNDDESISTAAPGARAISAFATDANPWYGYPAVRSGDTVRPRYNRNRKRDLVKTLLFLFILRIQSWRDAFERWLGLNKLGTWGRLPRPGYEGPKDPATGLVSSSSPGRAGDLVKQSTEKDWIWAVITFLLLRGTWTRILAGPLEAVGLGSVRDVLGLV